MSIALTFSSFNDLHNGEKATFSSSPNMGIITTGSLRNTNQGIAMSENQDFSLLESVLNHLNAGDKSPIASVLRAQDVYPLPQKLENKLSAMLETLFRRNFDQTKQHLIRIPISCSEKGTKEREWFCLPPPI
jgi:hypothetical protein